MALGFHKSSITIKRCQTHLECICGYNSVTPENRTLPVRMLQKEGYKRRKDKKTGEVFYTRYIKDDQCMNPGHLEEEEDDYDEDVVDEAHRGIYL